MLQESYYMHFKAENLTIPKHPWLSFLAQNIGVLRPSKSWGHFFWDTLYVICYNANKSINNRFCILYTKGIWYEFLHSHRKASKIFTRLTFDSYCISSLSFFMESINLLVSKIQRRIFWNQVPLDWLFKDTFSSKN